MTRKYKYLVPASKKTKRSSHRLTPKQVDELVRLYVSGVPAHRVGKAFGVSLDNVRYHVKKRGLWPGGRRLEPTDSRFWAKVDKSGECWLWTGTTFPNGYGCFSVEQKSRGAHRVAYELTNGLIPPAMTIDHLCRNKLCVNPAHLELVTSAENTRRHHRRKRGSGRNS